MMKKSNGYRNISKAATIIGVLFCITIVTTAIADAVTMDEVRESWKDQSFSNLQKTIISYVKTHGKDIEVDYCLATAACDSNDPMLMRAGLELLSSLINMYGNIPSEKKGYIKTAASACRGMIERHNTIKADDKIKSRTEIWVEWETDPNDLGKLLGDEDGKSTADTGKEDVENTSTDINKLKEDSDDGSERGKKASSTYEPSIGNKTEFTEDFRGAKIIKKEVAEDFVVRRTYFIPYYPNGKYGSKGGFSGYNQYDLLRRLSTVYESMQLKDILSVLGEGPDTFEGLDTFYDGTKRLDKFNVPERMDEAPGVDEAPGMRETPAPMIIETPVPMMIETPVPMIIETPVPMIIETPVPMIIETPVPMIIETPVPMIIETSGVVEMPGRF